VGLHDGHRERLKARFRTEGADRLQDHELLELLLFYAIPRSDTNELAHKLLLRFGSLQGVLEAEIPALCTVEGVGENTATLLKSVSALYQRTELRAAQTVRVLCLSAIALVLLGLGLIRHA
jgi:DNA repair protein RadC